MRSNLLSLSLSLFSCSFFLIPPLQAKHPYHTYELGRLQHGIKSSNIHCPDWFCDSLKHPNHSGLYIPPRVLDTNRYRSTSANGILFEFLGRRIKELARAELDDSEEEGCEEI